MDLRIKEILAQRGLTLKDFAQMSGISQSNLSNYLNGNILPTLDTLKKMASFLEIDVVELFKEKDDVELFCKYNEDPISKKINKIQTGMKEQGNLFSEWESDFYHFLSSPQGGINAHSRTNYMSWLKFLSKKYQISSAMDDAAIDRIIEMERGLLTSRDKHSMLNSK